MRQVALTIAGSDPSGGAGIQQDLKVLTRLGVYSCAVITAITVQNTTGVKEVVPLDADLVENQISFLMEDFVPDGIKIGMLSTRGIVEAVSRALKKIPNVPIVADPVMLSKNKKVLLEKGAIKEYINSLFPLIYILTPNCHEASMISGVDIKGVEDMVEAGKRILDMMSQVRKTSLSPVVVVKGGHLPSNEGAVDVVVTSKDVFFLKGERVDNIHTHGTGCTFSSAICGYLVKGLPLKAALKEAKGFVTRAIRAGFPLGRGIGPVNPLAS